MNRLRRILASLLTIAILLSPVSALAAEGLFRVPDFITEIESEAFSGVDVSNGVFIPNACTSIAPDAFSNPETLDVYGFTGSAAESYASQTGANFHAVDIENVTVSAPAWASPDREITFSADYASTSDATVRFEISKDGKIIHATSASAEKTAGYTFTKGGEYTITAIVENAFGSVRKTHETPVTVANRIKTNEEIFYLAVGQSADLVSEEETREVTLSASGLIVSGTTVTAETLGAFIVTAKAETAEGTVYTDIPVEVIIPASSVTITAEKAHVLENHTVQLTASVLPENATYQHVTWSIDNGEIAKIDQNGLLTGLKKGRVTVFAASGNIEGAYEIRVEKAVSSFEIAPAADMPAVPCTGMRFTLTAVASPADADNPTCSFESLTPEIASVDFFTGVVTCLREGEARIKATANDLGGATGEYTFIVSPGVTDITFASVPGILRAGETFRLELSVLPENAGDKTINYASSNEKAVTVTDTGLLTAVNPGYAVITVKAGNGFEKKISVTVQTPVTSVTTVLDALYLNPGMTADPIGNFVFVKPENATDRTLTWSSDNGLVATVDKDTGRITAVSDGTCTIKGVAHNGKTVSFTVNVVSDKPVIKKLALDHTYGALNVGNTAVLTPKADTNNKYTGGKWYSDHPEVIDIVSVSAKNEATIKALSAGSCTIYAVSTSGISTKCTIVVNPIIVKNIYLNAESVSLNVSDSFPLAATFYPENATATTLTWTSSNESVASVDENGLIRALCGGSAVITATTEDGISAVCRVTVVTIPMTSAEMTQDEITVYAGESGYPAYTVEPENATPASFFWRSSDTNVVSVSSMTGEMKYLKAGSAVVSGTALDGSGINIALTVNVIVVPITSLTANAESISLLPGETFALHTRVLPTNASFASPVFACSDETIASVTPDGLVTAVSKGSTEITVTVGKDDYIHTLVIPVTVEPVNDVTYRALIMGQFTVPATDGYLPFANNGTKGFADAISRSSIDGNRYQVTRILGSPTPGAIRSAISRMASQADENDVTVIFFLTHGTNDGNEGYVMRTNSGIDIESLDMINALKEISGNVVFVLCTCHSGRILFTSGANALKSAGGSYEGRNGKGHLSILCSSTSTNSSFYNINDEKISYDFYTYSVTRGLGWDMLNDCAIGSMLADANGDGKITVSELASYSRGATQRAISSFIQLNGTANFSGHAAQFPSWQIAEGHEDLVIFEK